MQIHFFKWINVLSKLPPFIHSEWDGHVQKSEKLFDCSQRKLSNSVWRIRQNDIIYKRKNDII